MIYTAETFPRPAPSDRHGDILIPDAASYTVTWKGWDAGGDPSTAQTYTESFADALDMVHSVDSIRIYGNLALVSVEVHEPNGRERRFRTR